MPYKSYSTPYARQCVTEGCTREARSLGGRCYTCMHRLHRFGHPAQTLPHQMELDGYIRRIEEQLGRIKLLDMEALKARWEMVLNECRARATPSYKDKRTMTYNGHDREGAQVIRDIGEAITFERALGVVGAVYLLQLERPAFFKSSRPGDEDAFKCSVMELLRRTSRVGCKVMAMNNANGAIERSYRRELSKNSRLAAFNYIVDGLGSASRALARKEHARKEQESQIRSAYFNAVASIAAE